MAFTDSDPEVPSWEWETPEEKRQRMLGQWTAITQAVQPYVEAGDWDAARTALKQASDDGTKPDPVQQGVSDTLRARWKDQDWESLATPPAEAPQIDLSGRSAGGGGEIGRASCRERVYVLV